MSESSSRSWLWLRPAFALLFIVAVVANAWVCDDAYISFRVIDNFDNGHGLCWNPGERVQVFTHPAWLLVLTGLTALTHEVYLSVLGLSIVLLLVFVWLLGWRLIERPDHAAVVFLAMAMSAAMVDYSTSGLENSLLNLLLAVLCLCAVQRGQEWVGMTAVALASCAAMTRPDSLALTTPIVVWCLASMSWRSRFKALVIGALPLVAWSVFATLYFGTPVPNTVLAKVGTGIPLGDLATQGAYYLVEAVRHDPVTVLVIAAGLVLGLMARGAERAMAIGVCLAIAGVIRVGGDFMAGRFLVAPFVVAMIIIGRRFPVRRGLHAATAAAIIVLGAPAPRSPYLPLPDDLEPWHGISNERAVYGPTTGLRPVLAAGSRRPLHPWVESGLDLRRHASGQVVEIYNAGLMGYYAGSGVHLVEVFGLTDPLLARLPMTEARSWRPGHYRREIPPGYLDGIADRSFRVANPDLDPYVQDIRTLSNAAVFGPDWRSAFVRIWSGHWRSVRQQQYDLARARTRGLDLLARQHPLEAIEAFDTAIRLGRRRSMSWFRLAEGRVAIDDNRGALEAIRQALELDPFNLDANKLYARLLVDFGDDSWQRLLTGRVVVLESCLVAAKNLVERNRPAAAAVLVEEALARDFEVCRFRDCPRTGMARDYRRALQATAHRSLAQALRASGRERQARRHLSQALQFDAGL